MGSATIIPDSRSASEAAASSGVYGLPSFSEYQNILAKQTAENNAWSAQQAQKQMEFQERLSNTAHQREVADLKAAGLNPVLSAGGSGAAALAGAQANPDQSGNTAMTTFLANLLQAQNQLELQRANAENALAVASMYNETSRIVGQISASASMYGANSAAAASRYSSDNALLNAREQRYYDESHPNSVPQFAASLLNSVANGLGYGSTSQFVGSLAASAAKGLSNLGDKISNSGILKWITGKR